MGLLKEKKVRVCLTGLKRGWGRGKKKAEGLIFLDFYDVSHTLLPLWLMNIDMKYNSEVCFENAKRI